jgi:pyruvate formate lyase activating enzyme
VPAIATLRETGPPAAAREALLWERRPDASVVCNLCAHRCRIRLGRRGICAVRENRAGTLVTLVWDRVVGAAIDPIEKKPFFHFRRGGGSLGGGGLPR